MMHAQTGNYRRVASSADPGLRGRARAPAQRRRAVRLVRPALGARRTGHPQRLAMACFSVVSATMPRSRVQSTSARRYEKRMQDVASNVCLTVNPGVHLLDFCVSLVG